MFTEDKPKISQIVVAEPALTRSAGRYRWGQSRVHSEHVAPRMAIHTHYCPECLTEIVPASGCFFCPACGWGRCG